jgi:hypothetical protein
MMPKSISHIIFGLKRSLVFFIIFQEIALIRLVSSGLRQELRRLDKQTTLARTHHKFLFALCLGRHKTTHENVLFHLGLY